MQIAVLDKLPPFTFLLGTDFGKDRLLSLMAHVKVSPDPVLAITRAMSADDTELAKKTAQALHLSEGASPVALDDIVEVSETEPALVSGPEQPVDVESPTPASKPGMMQDIREHISKCTVCSKVKKSSSIKAPMLPPEIIAERC